MNARPTASPSSPPPPLIRLDEIEQQPSLWRTLLATHQTVLGAVPVWDKHYQRVVGVGEGSSFNAFRLAQYQWQLWHPQVSASCLRPWELEVQLPLASTDRWHHSFWVPMTQSAKTASLMTAWQQLRQVIAPLSSLPDGLLVTNTALPSEDWQSKWTSHAWHLNAGPEQAIAATKTFTGSLMALWLLGVEQARKSHKWDAPRAQRVLDDLSRLADESETWLTTASNNEPLTVMSQALSGVSDYHPAVVILSTGPLVWSLAEAALKLTETTRQPVLYHHTENFKHGPKAMMTGHPLRHDPPCLVYVVPPNEKDASILYGDAVAHEAALDYPVRPKRLWIRFENSLPLPETFHTEPTIILPPAHNTRASLLLLTLCFQYIGYLISQALDLSAHGLQKAVES
jgi:glucosamine 6-phosphate synthetase-like amidotransferase/phosphosugar isomerase protein